MKKQALYLASIFFVIWLSMILGAYAAANFLVNLSLPIAGRIGAILSNAFKTVLGGLAALAWLYGWKKLSESYFYWSLRRGWGRGPQGSRFAPAERVGANEH